MKSNKPGDFKYRKSKKEDKLPESASQNKKKFNGKFSGKNKKKTTKKLSVDSIENRLNSMFDKAINNLGISNVDDNADPVEKKVKPISNKNTNKPANRHPKRSPSRPNRRPSETDLVTSFNMLSKDFYEFKHSVNQKLNTILTLLQEKKKS